jgi:hypothetical protein
VDGREIECEDKCMLVGKAVAVFEEFGEYRVFDVGGIEECLL